MTTNLILALIVAALQVGDGVTTAINLSRAGGKEHNPLIRKLIDRLGVVPALIVKGLVVAGLAIGLALAPLEWFGEATTLPTMVLGLLAAVYAFIVVKNARYAFK